MMERYAAYKDSGIEWIGEIPEGWNVSRVQNCFTEEKRTNEELDSFHALKFSNGSIIQKSESWDENEIADTYSAYKVVSSGAIVINNLNLNFDLKSLRVGMVEEEGIITSAYLTMNPSSDHQYPRYYDYLFKSYDYKKAFHNMGRGLRKTLNWQEFCKYSCIVPSPYEQNAIAGFLDTRTAEIDSLIAEQEKSIKLLQEYRKAVISEAVTKGLDPDVPMKDSGIEWIGEIPEGWSVVKQSMLGQSVLGKMLDEKTSKVGEMRPYLSNRDVQWLSINTTNLKKMGFPLGDNERYTLRNGDVLICEGGEIGRCAVWDKGDTNISFQKAVHRFRPNRNVLNSYYFAYEMFQKAEVSTFVEVRKGESTIAHLPGDQLGRLQILVPPLSEQSDIAMFLDHKTAETDSLISDKQQLIDKLKEYRKSLISEAVTGRFKVPGVA